MTRADELKRVYGLSLAHPIGMTLTFWMPPGVRTGRVPVILIGWRADITSSGRCDCGELMYGPPLGDVCIVLNRPARPRPINVLPHNGCNFVARP